MPNLEYSPEALNAKSAFYRAKSMIYVEGDDDLMFWEEVFSHVPDFSFEVESVGGSAELDKYIKKIEDGVLEAICARDADYLRFIGRNPISPRVIYTHGYSIENTLYTADALHHLARLWCKSNVVTQTQCVQWLNNLATSFTPLIALDIANAVTNSGVSVLPDNCARFMTSQVSATPCIKKIAARVTTIEPSVPKKAVSKAHTALASSTSTPFDYLRGHLLASAVIKFLNQVAKALGKKINVSLDGLYAAAIAHFGRSFTTSHPHYAYYSAATNAAAITLK